MTPRRWLTLFLAMFLLPAAIHGQAAKRKFTVDDSLALKGVQDPQITPDGQWVAYTVSTINRDKDKRESRIWMVATAGGYAIALTAEGVSSSHPRWSPDGKYLAFLSARNEGKTQVWLLNRTGGEAQKLTDTMQDVGGFDWAPDGKRLVLLLQDPTPDELEAAAKPKDGDKEADKKKSKTPKPWVIDRLQFKEDTIGYLDHRRTHLYVFELAGKTLAQVTSGDYDDSDPAWSPDSTKLAFTSNRSKPDPDRTYNTDIWTVAADNKDKGEHPTQITTNPGPDRQPTWSPDGKWIAYVTEIEPKLFQYETHHLGVSPSAGGEAKVLTRELDRNVDRPKFSADGKSIYFLVSDDGMRNLASYTLDAAAGTASFGNGKLGERPIGGRLFVGTYSFREGGGSSGNFVATVSTPDRPQEIFLASGGKLTQLTHVNDDLISKIDLARSEYVHFKSKDGTQVSGYLYRPVGYVQGTKVPTLLRPHGGPVGEYYAQFSEEGQIFAANGYAVLFPNPRGSDGYGQKFCQAIFADWGNKDYQDDMAMVDYAVAQGIADPDKLGVGGWSYGGISTDFIIGQTQRFKAAISGAGEALNISYYGHDHYIRDWETELGPPWEPSSRATWDKLSPFYRVKDITTPTLFMGGEIDWNVPILGGEQMYQAMRSLGRETALVVYPGEYHGFRVPSHIRDRWLRYLAWYAHYVKGDAAPANLPQDTSGQEKITKTGD